MVSNPIVTTANETITRATVSSTFEVSPLREAPSNPSPMTKMISGSALSFSQPVIPELDIVTLDWQLGAACRGTDSSLFFHPANERNTDARTGSPLQKVICRQCPAINACLDHVLRAREPYGIWGGLSEDERAQRVGVESLPYPALTPAT